MTPSDYGDIIYDQPNNKNVSQKLNHLITIQIEPLEFTGTIRVTPEIKYDELGLEYLNRFRRHFKFRTQILETYYKIQSAKLLLYL